MLICCLVALNRIVSQVCVAAEKKRAIWKRGLKPNHIHEMHYHRLGCSSSGGYDPLCDCSQGHHTLKIKTPKSIPISHCENLLRQARPSQDVIKNQTYVAYFKAHIVFADPAFFCPEFQEILVACENILFFKVHLRGRGWIL